MESNVNFKYYAFISYSHEDEEYAKRIQKKLTEYKLPSVIRKANPLLPDNVRPIFRDATNLTTGMLQETLHSELEHSKFLIVLCSPNSAKPNDENKHWVNNEVQHFIDLGRAEFIIPVIVGGEPHASNANEECFCPALLSLPGGDELLGIDIRKSEKQKISFGKNIKRKLGIPDENDLEEKATVHIVAKMLGLDIDDLWDWNKKAQKRKAYTRLFTTVAVFVVMVSVGLTVYFKKFHVYHEYYVDCIERWFVPEGIHKLTRNEIKKRAYSYRLDIQNGKVIRCSIIGSDNKVKKNAQIGDCPYQNYNIVCTYEYKNNSEIPYLRKEFGQNNKLDNELEIVKEDENVFRVNISKKTEGINAITLSARSVIGEIKTKISSMLVYFTDDGLVKRQVFFKYHDEDIIGFTPDNTCGIDYSFDGFGRIILENFLSIDDKENLIFHENNEGIACKKYVYSDSGYMSEITTCDLNGNPILINSDFGNCTMIRLVYDNNGNITRKEFYLYSVLVGYISFDRYNNGNVKQLCHFTGDSEPFYCNGVHKTSYEYDNRNNIISISYYDENNNNICYGNLDRWASNKVANRIFKYDASDNFIEEIDYGINNQKINDGTASIVKLKYDGHNNLIEKSFYDYDYDYAPSKETGCAVEMRIYNKKNELVEEQYYDTNRNLVNDRHGVAVYKYDYDKLGNRNKISFYDSNLNKTLFDGLYYSEESEFSDKGQLLEDRFLEIDETISQKAKAEYDKLERNIIIKWFDNNNHFIIGEHQKFDAAGRLLVSDTIDENNNLIVTDESPRGPVARIVYKYEEDYTQTSFYGIDNNPVMCPENYWMSREYKKNGYVTQIEYYDLESKLCCKKDGYAKLIQKYDIRGNCIFYGYYDEKSEPMDFVFDDGTCCSCIILNPENGYEPIFYDKYGKEIKKYTVVVVKDIYHNSQASNSEIKPFDILLEWNEWKYNPDDPNFTALMEEISLSENSIKHIKLYNSKDNRIYSCTFDVGKVGIHLISGETPNPYFQMIYEKNDTIMEKKTYQAIIEKVQDIVLNQKQYFQKNLNGIEAEKDFKIE